MNQEVNKLVAQDQPMVLAVEQAPTNVQATANSPTQVTITWTGIPEATGYNISQSTSASGPFTQIGSTVEGTFVATNLTPGTTYYFTVAGYDESGPGPASTAVAVTTPTQPSQGTLTGVALTSGCVQLTWNYTGEGTPVLYRILRSQNMAGPYVTLATYPTGVTNYLDCSLVNGQNSSNYGNATTNNYYYIVEVVTTTGTAVLGPTLVTITNGNGNNNGGYCSYSCYNPCRPCCYRICGCGCGWF